MIPKDEKTMQERYYRGLMKFYVVSATIASIALLIVLLACSSALSATIDLDVIKIIESSGNPLAYNKTDQSIGLYQITPICLKEWNNFNPKEQHTKADLWIPAINEKIADWYLNKRIPQMIKYYGKEDSIRNRIIAYNAGINYVRTGKPIPKITKLYLKKYQLYKGGE